jgi:DICT domain-containing protein
MTAQDYQYEILLDRMARMIFERETMSKGLWTDVQRRYYRALAAELLVLIEAHNDPKVEVSVKDLRGLLAESEVMATNLRSTGALTVPDYLYEIHRRLWKVLDEVDGK